MAGRIGTCAFALLGLSSSTHASIFAGAGFSIPDNNPVGGQSSITTDLVGVVTDISVTINCVTTPGGSSGMHTWIGDLVATLRFAPADGGPVLSQFLFNRIGASSSNSAGDSSDFGGAFTFGDSAPAVPTIWTAAAAVGATTPIPSGSYRASSRGADFQYQAVSLSSTFGGHGVAGTWTLTISYTVAGDTGGITGWVLNVPPSPSGVALAGVASICLLRRRR